MSEKMEAKARISILLCSRHGYYAVSFDDDTSGTRVTPEKCCGSWDTVRTFPMSLNAIDTAIQELRRLRRMASGGTQENGITPPWEPTEDQLDRMMMAWLENMYPDENNYEATQQQLRAMRSVYRVVVRSLRTKR